MLNKNDIPSIHLEVFMSESSDYIASNKKVWDRAALKYQPEIEPDLAFLRTGGVSLLEPERHLLSGLGGVQCAIHLQCSHGLDTLSLLNLRCSRGGWC